MREKYLIDVGMHRVSYERHSKDDKAAKQGPISTSELTEMKMGTASQTSIWPAMRSWLEVTSIWEYGDMLEIGMEAIRKHVYHVFVRVSALLACLCCWPSRPSFTFHAIAIIYQGPLRGSSLHMYCPTCCARARGGERGGVQAHHPTDAQAQQNRVSE